MTNHSDNIRQIRFLPSRRHTEHGSRPITNNYQLITN